MGRKGMGEKRGRGWEGRERRKEGEEVVKERGWGGEREEEAVKECSMNNYLSCVTSWTSEHQFSLPRTNDGDLYN